MIKSILSFLKAIRAFFPINLLFSQVKYNLVVLFYWIFLFATINDYLGTGIGLPYLFLSPEYSGSSTPIAFFLLGASIGGFFMSYHIYSYIQLGPKYPFIATLSRPFYKFSINNSLIPLLFLINFSVNIYHFQQGQEYVQPMDVFLQILSLLGGVALFILFALVYF